MTLSPNTTRGGNASIRVVAYRTLVGAAAGLCILAAGLPALAGVSELGGKQKQTPPRARSFYVGGGGAAAQPGVESTYVFNSNDNGKVVHLEIKNDVVTKAEVDGKTIPDNRIERDGNTIRLKDDQGNILFEQVIPKADVSVNSLGGLTGIPGGLHTYTLRGGPGGATTINGLPAIAAVEPVEAPKVMMGIQMAAPDGSLRGHLGLKDGTSTMLSAVHEGLPANKAGLGPYDIIVSIDGKDEASPEAIRAALKDKKPGDSVKLGVIQKGVRKDVTLTLEPYDRKKLDEAKIDAIADSGAWNGVDFMRNNNGAIARSLAGSGMPSDQLNEIIARIQAGQNWGGNPFVTVIPGPNGGHARALIDAEKIAEQARIEADKARAKMKVDHQAQMEDLHRQMEELHKMMQRMIEDQKPDAPAPQEEKPAPREGRS